MELQITFGHFCEIHGPSVVFNTVGLEESRLIERGEVSSRLADVNWQEVDPDLWSNWNPSEVEHTFLLDSEPDYVAQDGICCEGCSLHTNTGHNDLITFDVDHQVHYLTEGFSDRSTLFPRTFTLNDTRLICFRSLSCELYPQSGGMLYFGTDEDVHVLSFLFSLQDSKARGFHRKYTVVLMSKDNKHLFNHWNTITKHITLIITLLQRKAKAVFKSELKPETCLNKRSIILDKVANAGKNMNYFEEIFDHDASNTSKNKINARSLIEITGDRNIFYTLHMQFISILDQLSKRITSSGRPRNNLLHVEDIDTDLLSDQASLRELYALMGSEQFRLIASNVVLGNRLIVYDSNATQPRTKLLVSILSKLLPKQCIQAMTDLGAKEQPSLISFCAHVEGEGEDIRRLSADLCLCVEITDRAAHDADLYKGIGATYREQIDLLRRSSLKVHCCDEAATVPPLTYLAQVEQLLRDVSVSDDTLNACLNTLKLEWLNKSRTMQAFATQSTCLSSDNVEAIMSELGISTHDLRLVQFWSKL